MADLVDYSVAFNPKARYEDFSKETLVKLLKEYERAYLIVLGEWDRVLKERHSDTAALENNVSMWMTAGPLVEHHLCRALNINVGNAESFFKAIQMDPGFPLMLFDNEFELVNPNYGLITVKKCTALNAFEREGKGYEIPLCHIVEPSTMINTALYHNPNMIFKPVQLPPREDKGGIACKWEARIVPKSEHPFPYWRMAKRMGTTAPNNPREAGKPWSEKQIQTLWGYLSDDTKGVMRVIARKPEGCLKDDIIRELGINAEEMSYRLGFLYLAIFETPWRQKWAPVRCLVHPWRYKMDREWAQVIKKLSL